MASITDYIERKLGLKVNMTKTKVCKPNELKYLGFGFYKHSKYEVIPHKESKVKFKRKLKGLTKRSESISLDKRFEKLNWLIRGWVNYFKISKMKTFLKLVDEWLRTRIRMIIWKMCKLPKTRALKLMRCGLNKDEATRTAYSRKGYYALARTFQLGSTISKLRLSKPNKTKERRGLVFALDYYLA